MGWVHYHSHRVLEHCVCLPQLFCSCGCGMKFISLVWCGRHKNNNMIFDQKWIQNISFERVAEDNTRWVGCTSIHIECKNIVFASCTFSVLVVWKWNSFPCCGRHTNNMIFNQNEQQNISFERVAEDNTRWIGCTSIHHTHTYKVLIMLRFLWRLWSCRAALTTKWAI